MRIFTEEEKKKEAFLRVANVIYSCWRVGNPDEREKLTCGVDTRLLDILAYDSYTVVGESKKGRGHREHVVPRVMIVDESLRMFNQNYLVEDVAKMIEDNLKIVHITKEEQKYMDNELGYKKTMPKGWKFGDDIFARLKEAKIEIVFYSNNN